MKKAPDSVNKDAKTVNLKNKIWDNKFGLIDPDADSGWTDDPIANERAQVKIEGVGKDAEIITNEKGGKQSKTPMAMHLVDPDFLINYYYCEAEGYEPFINSVASFMKSNSKGLLFDAIETLSTNCRKVPIVEIAKVLQYGIERYEPNNWRRIPQEEHINHALIHYIAHLMGDTQDDHLGHCMCRLMMAYATETSPNFSYKEYIENV